MSGQMANPLVLREGGGQGRPPAGSPHCHHSDSHIPSYIQQCNDLPHDGAATWCYTQLLQTLDQETEEASYQVVLYVWTRVSVVDDVCVLVCGDRIQESVTMGDNAADDHICCDDVRTVSCQKGPRDGEKISLLSKHT